jgi:hypothetical protein
MAVVLAEQPRSSAPGRCRLTWPRHSPLPGAPGLGRLLLVRPHRYGPRDAVWRPG